jgi:hypothetical protein
LIAVATPPFLSTANSLHFDSCCYSAVPLNRQQLAFCCCWRHSKLIDNDRTITGALIVSARFINAFHQCSSSMLFINAFHQCSSSMLFITALHQMVRNPAFVNAPLP